MYLLSLNALALSIALLQTPDEETFRKFFEEFTKRRDAIQSLQASFTQESVTPDEIIKSTGTVTYARPKQLIFRYSDPEQVYLLDGNRAYEYDAELLQLQIFELEESAQAEAFYLGFESDAQRLLEANDVRILVDEVTGGFAIELTPKPDGEDDAFYQKATLHLRPSDYLPKEIHIVNDEDSETRITLGAITLNASLAPDAMQIALPEGTDIIENDEYIETVGAGGKRVPERADSPSTP